MSALPDDSSHRIQDFIADDLLWRLTVACQLFMIRTKKKKARLIAFILFAAISGTYFNQMKLLFRYANITNAFIYEYLTFFFSITLRKAESHLQIFLQSWQKCFIFPYICVSF